MNARYHVKSHARTRCRWRRRVRSSNHCRAVSSQDSKPGQHSRRRFPFSGQLDLAHCQVWRPGSSCCRRKTRRSERTLSIFVEDDAIPEKFRAKLKDYFRSGYDRGHQVPAADAKWSQQAMDDTFALSNMCPQVGEGFNRDYWAHFEDFCRRLTGRYPSVRIVTGPLYLPKKEADGKWRVSYEVIGNPPNVAVPTHFYKVIFAEDGRVGGNVSLGAFVLPNARIANDKPLQDFEVPLEAVER